MMNLRKEEIAKKASPAAAAKPKAPAVSMLKGAKLAMAPKVCVSLLLHAQAWRLLLSKRCKLFFHPFVLYFGCGSFLS